MVCLSSWPSRPCRTRPQTYVGLDVLSISLPGSNELFTDSVYTDYRAEDTAHEMDGVSFAVQRKRNSRRGDEPPRGYYMLMMRKRIETVFSQL